MPKTLLYRMLFDFSKSVHNSSCHSRFPRIGIIGHPRPRVIPTCAAVPAPARTVSGNVSYCRGPVRGEKQKTFCKCTQKSIISIPPRDTKPEFRGYGKVVFHTALEFSNCDEPFVRKSSESGQIGRAVDSRCLPGMTTRSTLRRYAIWGEGPVLQ